MKRLLFILLCCATLSLSAQMTQTTFGKNRVQYEQQSWKIISTKNFNIYYYLGGNSLAHNTARHLEEQYSHITHTIGYLPYSKINVLVYNCEADFQQSNINLENTISAGGETKLIKSRMEIAFKGNQIEYYKDLDKKLSELFINIIMYGGSIKNSVQSSYLIDFPAWFLSGCSNYLGYGNSEEMYNAVQDFIYTKKKNPDRLTGEYATLIGQSIFYYIHVKYGDYAIANILALTRSTKNEETGIRGSIGLDYKTFIQNWKKFYTLELKEQHLNKKYRIHKTSSSGEITQLKMNKEKSKIAYAINRKGIYYVYIFDTSSGKRTMLYYGGIKNINNTTVDDIPLIAWKSNTELCLIKYKKGKPYLITKNIKKKFQKEKKLFVTFDAILSFDFSINEEDMVLSGSKDGQTDIYIYNIKEDVAKQITKDLYDDIDPVYSPDGKRILFASNRFSDTLRGDYGSYKQMINLYNLYEFDGTRLLKKITNSTYNETKPRYWSENRILFLSSDGIKNQLFTLTIGEEIAKNIKTENKNIKNYLAKEGELYLKFRRKEKDYLHQKVASFEFDINNNYYAYNQTKIELNDTELPDEVLLNELLNVDPNKQAYDSDPKIEDKRSFLVQEDKTIKISNPKDIERFFAIDYFISTIKIDPLRNIGPLFEAGTSDMFGDHRLHGKLYSSLNLKSSDMYLEYEFLKYHLDFKAKIQKNSYYRDSGLGDYQRQTKSDFFVSVSKPFSPVARIEYTTGITRTSYIDYLSFLGVTEYSGFYRNALEFVYDNTFEKSLNQFQGFKMKAGAESYSKLTGGVAGFNKISFDIRNYQPIVRDIVFAARLTGGRYAGSLPRVFMIGGIDNWLGQRYEQNQQFNPIFLDPNAQNPYLLFNDYGTSLRGFGYNKMNGQNFLIFNSELRIPIIKVLYSGPISSSFFRNLQLNVFYEAGSAWNGHHPFSQDNSINTRYFGGEESIYSGKVINYQNPFLNAYGFGIRSMFYGYYVKLDLGWGVQNYVVKKPKLQLSLGYDF